MMDARLFHSRLFHSARSLISPGAKVLCAVSGGADSTALLHGLCAVNGLYDRRWLISIAHLDHQIRRDSAECAMFVQKLAGQLGLECRTESFNVPALIEAEGGSLEETARRVRYEFLRRTADDLGASVIAVAHHADDQAETVLHRVIRGTGLRGLAGMRASRPLVEGGNTSVVRPLLKFRRATLRNYLLQRALPFHEDPTNWDAAAATRNHLRQNVLPILEKTVNPKVVDALIRLAHNAAGAAEAIGIMATHAMEQCRPERKPGELWLTANALAALPAAVRSEVVRLVLNELGVKLGAIGQERIEAAADLACRDRRLRRIELPGNVLIERRGEYWIACANRPLKRSRTPKPSPIEPRHP